MGRRENIFQHLWVVRINVRVGELKGMVFEGMGGGFIRGSESGEDGIAV